MKTTVEEIKQYIKDFYGIEFEDYMLGDTKYIRYEKNKKEYMFSCFYCYPGGEKIWSISYSYFDKPEWYGYDGASPDEGMKEIDYWMNRWGFKKNEKQTSIFDFIGDE